MLLVLDTCSLGIASEPSGGVTLRVSDIEGLPGTTLLIPIVRDSALELHEGMGDLLKKTKVFGLDDLRKETHGSGTAAG